MSVRTFTRRPRAGVGMSPNQWVTQQGVDRARSLLETSDLPVESVPQAYRRTFHVVGASSSP